MKCALVFLILFCLVPILLGLTPIQEVLQYRYIEQIGSDNHEIQWILEPQNQLRRLTTVRLDETSVSLNDGFLSTASWTFSKPSTDCDIMAKREGNFIHVSGIFHGEDLQKKIKIDDTPWCQATSLALSSIIRSDCDEVVFWTIWTEHLSPHKVNARKCGIERITIQGKEVEAQKIEIRPKGLFSILWKGIYWFRTTDHLFLKYEGATGLPGSAKTTITLVHEEEPRIISSLRNTTD
jgi:hypothetical protein